MASIATIPYGTPVDRLEHHYLFSWARLREHPLTGALVPELEVVEPDITAAKLEHHALIRRLLRAEAAAQFADDALDWVVDRVSEKTKKDAALRKRLFGNRRPSDIQKPQLKGQLRLMMTWPGKLAQSKRKDVRELGVKLEGIIEQAKAAEAELLEAEAALERFASQEGTLGKLTDKLNALRKLIHGKLGQIRHDGGIAGTGKDRDETESTPDSTLWAESFFLQERSQRTTTLRELDRRIAAHEARLTKLKAQRTAQAKRAEELARSKREAERQALSAQLQAKLQAVQSLGLDIEQIQALMAQLDANQPAESDPDMELPDLDDEPYEDNIEDDIDGGEDELDDDDTDGSTPGG